MRVEPQIYIYVNVKTAKKSDDLQALIRFYLDNGENLVEEAGYIPLRPSSAYKKNLDQFNKIMGQ